MHDLQDGRSTVTYQVSRFYNILWILKFYSFVPGICLIQVLRCDGHHLHQASNINLNLCYWKKGSWTHGCIWLLLSVRLSSGCQVCNQSEKKDFSAVLVILFTEMILSLYQIQNTKFCFQAGLRVKSTVQKYGVKSWGHCH